MTAEARANIQLCADLSAELLREGVKEWNVTCGSWSDCARATKAAGNLTPLGNNITDVNARRVLPDGTEHPAWLISGNLLHDPSTLISLDQLNAVVDDLEGGKARTEEPDGARVTVASVLENFGKHFKHLGADNHVNMLGTFKKCTFRVQVHVLELEVGQTMAEFEEGHLLMTSQNYQSRADDPRNVNLLFTTQGVSATTDASPPGVPVPLYLQSLSALDGEVHNYTIGVEATKRDFSQTGAQTREEADEQAERGRGVEAKLGPEHENMPKMCAVMHLQVPCRMQSKPSAVLNPMSLVAAAAMDMDDDKPFYPSWPKYASMAAHLKSLKPVDEDMNEDMDDEGFEHVASPARPMYRSAPEMSGVYRSGGALGRANPPLPNAVKPAETCRAASTLFGKDMGVAESPFAKHTLAPDDTGNAGWPTLTFCIFMVKPKGVEFGSQDVKNAIAMAERVRACAGETVLRDHQSMKDAGVTTPGITQKSAIEIAETFKALYKGARKSNVPIGVF